MSEEFDEIKRKLRLYYGDIIRGYSRSPNFDLYIKHLNDDDLSIVEYEIEAYWQEGLRNGFQTKAQKLEQAIESGGWSVKEEAEWSACSSYMAGQKTLKEKAPGKMARLYEQNIEDKDKEYRRLSARRDENIGTTLEYHIAKKTSDLHIFYSFYEDPKCEEPYFTEEAFDYIDQPDLDNLIIEYNLVFTNFQSLNIQRIATQPYFLNKYFLSNGDPRVFFGKTCVELTLFQTELLGQGKTYKNILENDKDGNAPPSSWYDDPDRLVHWYMSRTQSGSPIERGTTMHSKMADKDSIVATSKPGMTPKEMEAAEGNEVGQSVDLDAELQAIKDEKGDYDIYDLLKIHGVNTQMLDGQKLEDQKPVVPEELVVAEAETQDN